MGSPTTASLKNIAACVLVASALGALWWRFGPDQLQQPMPAPSVGAAPGSGGPSANQPAASTAAPATQFAGPELEVAPPAEEGPLLPFLARESFGHRAGLHKVKAELPLSASAARAAPASSVVRRAPARCRVPGPMIRITSRPLRI